MTVRPTAIVTGANSGIGLGTVRGLAREGIHVVMVRRNQTRAGLWAATEALVVSSPPRPHAGPS